MDPDSSLPRSSRLTIRLLRSNPRCPRKTRSTLFMAVFPLLVCFTVLTLLMLSSDATDASAKGPYLAEKDAIPLATPQHHQNNSPESKRTWSSPYPLTTPILVLLFLGMLFWLFSKSRQEVNRRGSGGGMRSKRHLA